MRRNNTAFSLCPLKDAEYCPAVQTRSQTHSAFHFGAGGCCDKTRLAAACLPRRQMCFLRLSEMFGRARARSHKCPMIQWQAPAVRIYKGTIERERENAHFFRVLVKIRRDCRPESRKTSLNRRYSNQTPSINLKKKIHVCVNRCHDD